MSDIYISEKCIMCPKCNHVFWQTFDCKLWKQLCHLWNVCEKWPNCWNWCNNQSGSGRTTSTMYLWIVFWKNQSTDWLRTTKSNWRLQMWRVSNVLLKWYIQWTNEYWIRTFYFSIDNSKANTNYKLVLEMRKKTKNLMKEIGEIKKENRALKKKNKDSKQLLKQKIRIIKQCCNQINMCAENI